MIEQLSDMPAGTLGFVLTGDVTRDEYRQVLLPPMKEAVESGRHDAWERTAIVTDEDWISRASRLFAWMVPGELRVHPLGEVDEARAWLAGQ